MLTRSGFMIIRGIVLLSRIREKMVGCSEGSKKKPVMYPRQAPPRKWPQRVNKQEMVGDGGWAVVGALEGKWGSFQRLQRLNQTFSRQRRFHQICGGLPASPNRCGGNWGGGPQAQVFSEAVQVKQEAHKENDGTHKG